LLELLEVHVGCSKRPRKEPLMDYNKSIIMTSD
jgi:hypothetical protein